MAIALLRRPVDGVDLVHGAGRNSRIYRVRCGSESFALKQYPPRQNDARDRLGTEIGALELMNRNGIGAVPALIASDRTVDCAIFEWIEGDPVVSPTLADIDAAIDFLAAIHRLRTQPVAAALAAEACLSGAEIVAQIERRLGRFGDIADGETALADFIAGKCRPLFAEMRHWAEAAYAEHGLDFAAAIPHAAHTLCPSDFGFHNAIRRPDGNLVFIDFDYFGWDDPVKLVSDFLLHPGMNLTEPLKQRFAGAAIELYGDDPSFAARLRVLYPLFGLRWCMILLNEFLPERWTHRLHAGTEADWAGAKRRQLDRAQEWVQTLAANFRWFPYA